LILDLELHGDGRLTGNSMQLFDELLLVLNENPRGQMSDLCVFDFFGFIDFAEWVQ
jgi:hypothetical protein